MRMKSSLSLINTPLNLMLQKILMCYSTVLGETIFLKNLSLGLCLAPKICDVIINFVMPPYERILYESRLGDTN